MAEKTRRTMRILGEVLSQLLNVPILSGAVATFCFFVLPAHVPHRVSSYVLTLVFLSLIPLCSLFFYIPIKRAAQKIDWSKIFHRQRIASFIFMIISYPIGFIILKVLKGPKIFEVLLATYTLVTVLLILFNLVIRYKASGHAAGVAGPVTAMVYLYGLVATPLILLIPLVTAARLMAKGHDVWQTIVGASLSVGTTIFVLAVYQFPIFAGQVF
ncbi:MAG: hypothetical protein K8I82_17600 [Anaerolineae bacterium]|nr:hypothetical protein [Anaerolineae bacterium]